MEAFNIFEDIATRTGGDIYIGVVGPVRTGKSTFIRKFVEKLVLPNIADEYMVQRTRDELPQSSAGKQVMTVEPKFVPDEGVEINLGDAITLRVRLVDSVGYAVEGATGYLTEDGQPRMVVTPWADAPMNFHEAAELGTRKVITEHSTIGVVVTTDGSITDLARGKYLEAEQRVIDEMKELGKPFVVVLNTTRPYAPETMELAGELEEKYGTPVLPVDISELSSDDITLILEQALLEFPVREVNIALPRWVEELDRDHWLRQQFEAAIADAVQNISRIRDVDAAVEVLGTLEFVDNVHVVEISLGEGNALVETGAREDLYYQVLEEIVGAPLEGKHTMIRLMRDLTHAKREYDKVAGALAEVRQVGYGMVQPRMEEISFEEPELVKQGHLFGVKLRAHAPSLHFIRADIQTEVTPIIGTEKQGEELVQYLMDRFQDDPKQLWDFDIFGKSLYDLVRDGITTKLHRMPDNAQMKLQETLTRIINEGSGGLIAIII
jgi:stage IV sporulation protein A